MSSRFHVVVLAAMIAVFAFTTTGSALEKTSARLDGSDRDIWRAGTVTCSIVYYNTCTGWIWVWSGWSPTDRFGVHFYRGFHSTSADVVSSFVFFSSGSPSGYGFTGTIDVFNADSTGCLVGSTLDAQPFLPLSNWNQIDFLPAVSVGPSFAVTYTLGSGTADPVAIASDHPAVGPTGPAACGNCYPTTRGNHSFFYGAAATPLCPGSALNDGVCDAELLWDAQVMYGAGAPTDCASFPVSVQEQTWGSIKALYR